MLIFLLLFPSSNDTESFQISPNTLHFHNQFLGNQTRIFSYSNPQAKQMDSKPSKIRSDSEEIKLEQTE